MTEIIHDDYYIIYRLDFATQREYFHSIYTDRLAAKYAEAQLMKQDKNANYKIESTDILTIKYELGEI